MALGYQMISSQWLLIEDYDLLYLTPLSAEFQLYHGDQF
jgi:hypothetical protein